MRSTVEKIEDNINTVKLTIDMAEDDLAPYVESSYKKIARQARIPGFRPGKAPRRVIEAKIGKQEIRREAIEEALEVFYKKAIQDNDLDVIAAPKIEITDGEADGDVSVDVIVGVRPRVQVDGYGGLVITLPALEVSDEDIADSLRRLQEQAGELEDVDRAIQDGDQVTLDLISRRMDQVLEEESRSDISYRIGKDRLIENLDDLLIGRALGDVVDVAVPGELEDVNTQVAIKAVRVIKLPDLDDEFAQEASEFETLEELRADIGSQIARMKKSMVQSMYRQRLLDELIALAEPKDVPETLVGSEVNSQIRHFGHRLESQGMTLRSYLELTGQSQDQLMSEFYETASKSVLADLALRAVGEAEGLEVTEAELEEKIEEAASDGKTDLVTLRNYYDDLDNRRYLRSEMVKDKAIEHLISLVRFEDGEGLEIKSSDLIESSTTTTDFEQGEPGDDGQILAESLDSVEDEA